MESGPPESMRIPPEFFKSMSSWHMSIAMVIFRYRHYARCIWMSNRFLNRSFSSKLNCHFRAVSSVISANLRYPADFAKVARSLGPSSERSQSSLFSELALRLSSCCTAISQMRVSP